MNAFSRVVIITLIATALVGGGFFVLPTVYRGGDLSNGIEANRIAMGL